MTPEQVTQRLNKVIRHRNCTGCGACVLFSNGTSKMVRTPRGPVPDTENGTFEVTALEVCPGMGINYPELYGAHYGRQPANYLHGMVERVRIGYSGNAEIRRKGASGGVITSVLAYLLRNRLVDGVVQVQQGIPGPREASAYIARTEEALLPGMQSVYIPVATLDILDRFTPGETYAMVLLPEQSSTLRKLQQLKHPAARQVKYVLGPYTGTALYPAAIDSFLRARRVPANDTVTSLRWREGEWPGHLEIRTASGRVLQSKKIYYNFLIPFFITHTSLRSMDFVNEFSDLAVGDAWSPKYEKEGKGFSVFVTRTAEMEQIVGTMTGAGLLEAEPVHADESVAMHAHMLDFKKRGGYLRNRMRAFFGYTVPDYGYRPAGIRFSRKLTEVVISLIFLAAGTRLARACMQLVPEKVMGPAFDFLRLRWKKLSKPAKRKGLSDYRIVISSRDYDRD
jgi:coenzyme F420 hydrogenase subunit beta